MKNIIWILMGLSMISCYYLNEIYAISIKDIDGKKVDIVQFRGRKLLFIVVPVTTGDTAVNIDDIHQLQIKHQDSLRIIGVPAEEWGFKNSDKINIKALYKDVSNEFLLAEGMKVKKGGNQSELFEWLTDKSLNLHFDKDVRGVGSKYFVDEYGELYAVIGPELKLNNPMVEKILRRQRLR